MSDAWRIVSPAPRTAALALAGAFARVRRAVLAQVRRHESLAIYRGADVMAVAMFDRFGWRRLEMALAIDRDAKRHMRRLVRIAQLTLPLVAETHIVVIRVHPANLAGQRMARLAGFRPAKLKRPGLWVYRRHDDGADVRGRREEGGAGSQGGTGRGE